MGRKPKTNPPPNDRISPQASPFGADRYRVAAVCGFLLLAVALVFGRTVGYGFVNYDDDGYVYENQHLARGLAVEEVAWAMTATQCSNWHPLTWISYLLDAQLYGMKPWGYHLTNVLLHAATAVGLFLVLRRITGDLWPSAFVAAVFAVHPLRVESVAWVAERKDVLSGLFFVLTLAAYAGYVRRPFSLLRYLTVAGCFALGLMAKPMLVTLPLVLLLLDYWPLGRMAASWGGSCTNGWGGSCTATPEATVQLSPQRTPPQRTLWQLVIEKLPLLALSAVSCAATSVAQRSALARFDSLPLGSRAANAAVSCVDYIGKLLCPIGLAVFYPHPGDGLPVGQIIAAVLLLAAITVAAAVLWRRCPWLPVGWFWYVGMLVPVIGLVQVGAQAMADRYTYLPQIGLAMALAWGAKNVFGEWPYRDRLYAAVSALMVAVLMTCAWQQTAYWRNSDVMWHRALSCTQPSALAHYNLAMALVGDGRLDEAIAEYREALEIKPDMLEAHNNLGIALAQRGNRGDYAEAAAHYHKALAIKPDFAQAYGNLGIALVRQGRLTEAIPQLEKAIRLKPDDVEAHYNLGTALARLGRSAEAIEQLEKVLVDKPAHAEAHNHLGLTLAGVGRTDEAIAHYQQALQSKPDYAEAHNNLGLSLAHTGRLDEAAGHFQKALELSPGLAIAHQNLAMALAGQGKTAEAIAQWREVIRLQPENRFAIEQLAHLLTPHP